MQWLNDLKVAIVSENLEEIESLIDSIPSNLNLDELFEVSNLLKECTILLKNRQKELKTEFTKLNLAKKYQL